MDLVGDELINQRAKFASPHVRPSYVKIFLDGVPMSRTSAFIDPYLPDKEAARLLFSRHHHQSPAGTRAPDCETGRAWLGRQNPLRWRRRGANRSRCDRRRAFVWQGATSLTHQIAHAGFVDPADIGRFRELNVVADLSPILWYPNQIIDGIEQAVGDRVRQYWPNRNLLEAGALIATGTDWPVIPNPDPWSGLEGLITRRNPDGRFDGALWFRRRRSIFLRQSPRTPSILRVRWGLKL